MDSIVPQQRDAIDTSFTEKHVKLRTASTWCVGTRVCRVGWGLLTLAVLLGFVVGILVLKLEGPESKQEHDGQAAGQEASMLLNVKYLHANVSYKEDAVWYVKWAKHVEPLPLSSARVIFEEGSTTFLFQISKNLVKLPLGTSVTMEITESAVWVGHLFGSAMRVTWKLMPKSDASNRSLTPATKSETQQAVLLFASPETTLPMNSGSTESVGALQQGVIGKGEISNHTPWRQTNGTTSRTEDQTLKVVSIETTEEVKRNGDEAILIPELPFFHEASDSGTPRRLLSGSGDSSEGEMRNYSFHVQSCGQSNQNCQDLRVAVQTVVLSKGSLLIAAWNASSHDVIGSFLLVTREIGSDVRISPSLSHPNQMLLRSIASELGSQISTTRETIHRRLNARRLQIDMDESSNAQETPLLGVHASQRLTYEHGLVPTAGIMNMQASIISEHDIDYIRVNNATNMSDSRNESRGRSLKVAAQPKARLSAQRRLELKDVKQLDNKTVLRLTKHWEVDRGLSLLTLHDWGVQLEEEERAAVQMTSSEISNELRVGMEENLDLDDMDKENTDGNTGGDEEDNESSEQALDAARASRTLYEERTLEDANIPQSSMSKDARQPRQLWGGRRRRRRRRRRNVRRRRSRRRDRRRRSIPAMLDSKVVQKKWETDPALRRAKMRSQVKLLSTRILGYLVRVIAHLHSSSTLSWAGSGQRDLRVSNFQSSSEYHLLVGGRTVYVLNSAVAYSKSGQWFRACNPVFFLQLCITLGGNIRLGVETLHISAWATGSVGVYVAEAGVRATGTLLNARLTHQPLFTQSPLSLCHTLDYRLDPMRFQMDVIWRVRSISFRRRRRWWGGISFSFGSWRRVMMLIDVEWGRTASIRLYADCLEAGRLRELAATTTSTSTKTTNTQTSITATETSITTTSTETATTKSTTLSTTFSTTFSTFFSTTFSTTSVSTATSSLSTRHIPTSLKTTASWNATMEPIPTVTAPSWNTTRIPTPLKTTAGWNATMESTPVVTVPMSTLHIPTTLTTTAHWNATMEPIPTVTITMLSSTAPHTATSLKTTITSTSTFARTTVAALLTNSSSTSRVTLTTSSTSVASALSSTQSLTSSRRSTTVTLLFEEPPIGEILAR